MSKKDRPLPSLEQLRCLVTAVEYKSLTAAATASGAAQSAFSRQLASLEETLGGSLLHRTGRGVEPTELGRRVLPRAQALLSEADELVEEARGRWNRPTGTVSVGIVPSLVRPLTSRLFDRVRQDFPEVQLRIFEAYSGEVETMLAEGRIDVGVFSRYRPTTSKGPYPVLTAPMCLVGSAKTLECDEKSVRFSVLADKLFVLQHRPNTLRAMLDETATRRGFTLKIALEADSSAAIKDAVINCGLYTILPLHAITSELKRGEVAAVPITQPSIQQATFLDTTRRRPASAAVREVNRVLRNLVAQLAVRT